MFLEIKSGKDKDSVWVKAEDISMFECKEPTDMPSFSWCALMHMKNGESYDMYYSFNRESVDNYINDVVRQIN
jgi:hypothetical protein